MKISHGLKLYDSKHAIKIKFCGKKRKKIHDKITIDENATVFNLKSKRERESERERFKESDGA